MEETKTVRLDEKVLVRSIAPWATGAQRLTSIGEISIVPNGSIYLTREEIIAQGQSGNKLINGVSGNGDHATWLIEDDFTKKELGIENQSILTKDKILKWFELKTQKAFEDNIIKNVVTRAEKFMLIDVIKNSGLNDFQKISFCYKHTGIKM